MAIRPPSAFAMLETGPGSALTANNPRRKARKIVMLWLGPHTTTPSRTASNTRPLARWDRVEDAGNAERVRPLLLRYLRQIP